MGRSPFWLRLDVVEAVHELLLAEHGGSPGLRDIGLLESALARPRHLFSYEKPDLFDLAAAHAFGIVRNHPFVDGNKRSGFMAAWTFLIRNGKELTVSETDAVFAMNAVAARELKEGQFAQWLRKNSRAHAKARAGSRRGK